MKYIELCGLWRDAWLQKRVRPFANHQRVCCWRTSPNPCAPNHLFIIQLVKETTLQHTLLMVTKSLAGFVDWGLRVFDRRPHPPVKKFKRPFVLEHRCAQMVVCPSKKNNKSLF